MNGEPIDPLRELVARTLYESELDDLDTMLTSNLARRAAADVFLRTWDTEPDSVKNVYRSSAAAVLGVLHANPDVQLRVHHRCYRFRHEQVKVGTFGERCTECDLGWVPWEPVPSA